MHVSTVFIVLTLKSEEPHCGDFYEYIHTYIHTVYQSPCVPYPASCSLRCQLLPTLGRCNNWSPTTHLTPSLEAIQFEWAQLQWLLTKCQISDGLHLVQQIASFVSLSCRRTTLETARVMDKLTMATSSAIFLPVSSVGAATPECSCTYYPCISRDPAFLFKTYYCRF